MLIFDICSLIKNLEYLIVIFKYEEYCFGDLRFKDFVFIFWVYYFYIKDVEVVIIYYIKYLS